MLDLLYAILGFLKDNLTQVIVWSTVLITIFIWIRVLWQWRQDSFILALVVTVFTVFFAIFVDLFFHRLVHLIGSLYEIAYRQIDYIHVFDDAFKHVSLSVGGSITLSIALLGVILTIVRNILTRQQNNTDEQRLITEQISRAIDQIGAYKQDAKGDTFEPNIEVRLGGLYSLQRILQDSTRDERSIAKIFYAYVRENIKEDKPKPKQKKQSQKPSRQPREDIQAALDIISQFNKAWRKRVRKFPPDSRLNFARIDFTGYSLANMDLSRAILQGANVSRANLSNADLSGANVSRANLFNADLSGANASRANLDNANLDNADLFGINLSRADLDNADLTEADLSWANLSRSRLFRTNFTEADLSWANLSRATLFRANFTEADLSGVNFKKARLYRVNLTRAKVYSANLTKADLDSANLSNANLFGTNFKKANLSDADLSGAFLSRTKNLTQEQINEAKGNEKTMLPDGLKRPKDWIKKKKPTKKPAKKIKIVATKTTKPATKVNKTQKPATKVKKTQKSTTKAKKTP